MARGKLAAVRLARFPCPASGRQLGHVRKSIDKKKWSARFKFKRQGDPVTLDGPARTLKANAEAELLSVTTNTSTQALPGCTTSRKRPAAAPALAARMRKRPAAVHRRRCF